MIGFDAVLATIALSLVDLLLMEPCAMFIDKSRDAGQKQAEPAAWMPDRLAKMGTERAEGTFWVPCPMPFTAFHLLDWSEQVWENGLLTSATVRLTDAHAARVMLSSRPWPADKR